MNTCSICNKEFEDTFFNVEQGKCLLHCKKTISYEADDINAKLFFAALADYIATQVLDFSNERDKTRIINYLTSNVDVGISIRESVVKDKIILKDIIFPTYNSLKTKYNFINLLNKLIHIEFKNCYFQDEILLYDDKYLTFRRCTFSEDWHHIISKEIKYLECKFENFVIDNPTEDKFIVKNHLLYNCSFENIRCSGTRFKKSFFKFNNNNKYKKIENIELINCEFDKDFILTITDNENKVEKEYFEIRSINLEHSIFNGKVKMQYCTIKEEASFYNTKFKDLADFYRTKFNEVIFERTDFEAVVVFSEVEFNQDVNFKYTKFLGYSVFRDTVIKGKLDLRNAIFDTNADANFLDITSEERVSDNKTNEFYGEPKVIQVANRETARIIKSFYEYTNNIIEANKFYALEMKERENELSKDFKKFKNIPDWLIFKIHGISSDHSQSPFLALLWIFNITIFYSILSHVNTWQKPNLYCVPIVFITLSILYFCIIEFAEYKYKKQIFSILFLIFLFASHFLIIQFSLTHLLNDLADKINPFSIMTTPDKITFGLLIYKTIIAYLIYQFIVSVRQNTRRK